MPNLSYSHSDIFYFNSHVQLMYFLPRIAQTTIRSCNKKHPPKLRFDTFGDIIEINFAAQPQQSDPIRVDIVRGYYPRDNFADFDPLPDKKNERDL